MAIDLRNVEPLAAKSGFSQGNNPLVDQALRKQTTAKGGANKYYDDMVDSESFHVTEQSLQATNLQWLKEDKANLQRLIADMESSVADLSLQVQMTKSQSLEARSQIEKEQQLLFKQIRTLNGLLKKQVDLFSAMENQVHNLDIQRGPVWQQVAVGLIAGLASAVTLLALSPVAMQWMQSAM